MVHTATGDYAYSRPDGIYESPSAASGHSTSSFHALKGLTPKLHTPAVFAHKILDLHQKMWPYHHILVQTLLLLRGIFIP